MAKHDKAANAAISDLEGIKAKLEEAAEQLEADIDAKSDRWREGEAGERASAQLDSLRSGIDSIETAIGEIEESINPN